MVWRLEGFDAAGGVAAVQFGPEFFADVWHEGVGHSEDLVEAEGGELLGGASGFALGVESGFDPFEVPVAEFVPEEAVEGHGGVVVEVAVEVGGELIGGGFEFGEDPAVFEGQVGGVEGLRRFGVFEVHEDEAGGVPEFGSEASSDFETFGGVDFSAVW